MAVRTVLLYSGGMDSFAIRHLIKPDISLYVDMGTKYSPIELSRLDPLVQVVRLPLSQWELPDGIIPLRNLLLVCVAAQYGERIVLGATAGDRVLDKNRTFAYMASQLLSYLWQEQHWTQGKTIEVTVPYKDRTKAQIVAEYLRAGGDPDRLAATVSCYHPNAAGKPCGECKPCWRKWVAFRANGLKLYPSSEEYIRSQVLPTLGSGGGRGSEDIDLLRVMGESGA